MTSHDVVARVRRLLHTKRVGHAGTLDPLARGVLPICVGQATRMVEYLGESGKSYRAIIKLGETTTTDDAEGEILTRTLLPATLTPEQIAYILPRFVGTIAQVPPMYSALKHEGKRLYELARAGTMLDLPARPVEIMAITLEEIDLPSFTITVDCGKGTYIRSLARDIGIALGVGAHLSDLERTRVGPFRKSVSLTLAALATQLEAGEHDSWWYAADEAVLHLPVAIVGAGRERRIRQGVAQQFGATSDSLLRAYTTDGRFLAILEKRDARWWPIKVMAGSEGSAGDPGQRDKDDERQSGHDEQARRERLPKEAVAMPLTDTGEQGKEEQQGNDDDGIDE